MNDAVLPPEAQSTALASPNSTSLLSAIARAAADPAVDMDKMERLYAMYERVMNREAEAAFNDAMARTQAKIQPIVNNAENDHTQSRYATLSAINRVIVPIYSAEGLSVSYDTETKNDADPIPTGHLRTIALVSHAKGHTRRYHIDLPPDAVGAKGNTNKTGVQAAGSTNEYARRYLSRMVFNISTYDDTDGNPSDENKDKKPKSSISESQYADFENAIDAAVDEKSLAAIWASIYEATNKGKDAETCRPLRAKWEARRAALKDGSKKK